jgi:pre-rRNA-processing protein TSR3
MICKMQLFPPTVIIRHCRENLKKCSLRGLEPRTDFQFFTYPHFSAPLPNLKGYILLTLEAQPLTAEDSESGLLLLDGTWRYAEKMEKFIQERTPEISLIRRSLPSHYRTAYPRVQNDCIDPTRGLSSIEAIYLCYRLLGRETEGLLDQYYWRKPFLEKNQLYRT